ncbi:MAG: hypothetical protein ACJ0RM_04930 [Alphaproteobacteria bacterium]
MIYIFNLFYTISIIPIGISIFYIGLNIFFKINKKKQIALFFIIIIAFVTSYTLLCKKNINNFSIPFTSTVQGQNSLQFSVSNNFISSDELINFIEKGNYPNWYKMCAKNAHEKYSDHESIIYGNCVFKEKDGRRLGKYDTNFLDFIYDNSPNYIKKNILIDLSNILTSGYILNSFGIQESNLHFSAEYGKISKKVSRDLLIKFPIKSFLDNFYNSIEYLILDGSYFFQGNKYEPQIINLPYIHNIIGKFIGIFLLLGSIFSLIYFLYLTIIFFRGVFKFDKLNFKGFLKQINKDRLFLYILSNIVLLTFALSTSTCCENARMFVIISPLSLIAFCYLYKDISLKKKIKIEYQD